MVVEMVEIIETKKDLKKVDTVGVVNVTSFEDLKKIASGYGEPFIFKKGENEYYFFHANVCYRHKEK